MEKKETNSELEINDYKAWCKKHNKSEKDANSLSEYLKSLEEDKAKEEKQVNSFKYLGEHIEDAKNAYDCVARLIDKLETALKHHESDDVIENLMSLIEIDDVCNCMKCLLYKSEEILKLLYSSVELAEYVKHLHLWEVEDRTDIMNIDKKLIEFIKVKVKKGD